jgi:hypothetical protein
VSLKTAVLALIAAAAFLGAALVAVPTTFDGTRPCPGWTRCSGD